MVRNLVAFMINMLDLLLDPLKHYPVSKGKSLIITKIRSMKILNVNHLLTGKRFRLLILVTAVMFTPLIKAGAQSIADVDRERAMMMLKEIKSSLKKDYYDPTFHGINIEERFKNAGDLIKQATSLGQAFGIIAQSVMVLNDSHTYFLPPSQTVSSDYGWEMQALGDRCYVSAVKPKSDAEVKGLKPGDLVLAINGVPPSREEKWKIDYLYNTLRPQAGMRLLVQTPDGQRRELEVLAKVKNEKRKLDFTGDDGGSDIANVIRDIERDDQLHRHRYYELGDDLMVWKMPQFDMTDDAVDSQMDKVRKHKALILDLRGNGGGAEVTLLRMIGNLFDHDVTIGTLKRRSESKPLIAKTRGQNIFNGKLVVLIDSESGSASELLARVVQLEKRATVIGDRSAGAVMRARRRSIQMGIDTAVFYGVSITDADIVMQDGKSLEHFGVTPDLLMLPTAKDIVSKRDPVLSTSATQLGVAIDPEKAGSLFPREWRN